MSLKKPVTPWCNNPNNKVTQTPSVSVIILAKNSEQNIARCLTTVAGEQPKNEVIVVLGQSTDHTEQIVSKYHVKTIRTPSKGDSIPHSRNIGAAASTNQIIAYMDADDYPQKGWLTKMVQALSNPTIAMAYPNRHPLDNSNWFFKLLATRTHKKDVASTLPTCQGAAFKTDILKKLGGFNETMKFGCEDAEIAERIKQTGHQVTQVTDTYVYVTRFNTIKEYFKDRFYRNGVAHGYKKWRYSRIGLGTIATLTASLTLMSPTPLILLTILTAPLIKEAIQLHKKAKPHLIIPFFLIRWTGRTLEATGYCIGLCLRIIKH